jgi:hypothetical protein
MRKPKDPKTARRSKSAKRATESPAAENSELESPEIECTTLGSATSETAIGKETPAPEPETVPELQAEPETVPELAKADPPREIPPSEERPHEVPHHDEPHHDEQGGHDEDNNDRSLATTALMVLVGVIVVASLTLWAAPKLAPHLPVGVAQYLLPGQMDTQARLASLDDAFAAEAVRSSKTITDLKSEIAALAGRVDTIAQTNPADAGLTEAAIAEVRSAADAAANTAATLATQLELVEAEIASLRDEFSAVSTALADAGTGAGATSAEIAAAVAALGARLDSLAASVDDGTLTNALDTRINALSTRIDAVETNAADARYVQEEALGKASTAIHQARLQAAVDLLAGRLTGGVQYADKRGVIAGLAEVTPPEALAIGANTGLATAATLEASFGRHAQAAVAADVQSSAGEGTGSQALGWLQAQIAGRPTTEQNGDDVGAVTSRIAARIADDKLAEALIEAETLPEHAQAGLGVWLEQLRNRVAADAALADWRTQIGAGG